MWLQSWVKSWERPSMAGKMLPTAVLGEAEHGWQVPPTAGLGEAQHGWQDAPHSWRCPQTQWRCCLLLCSIPEWQSWRHLLAVGSGPPGPAVAHHHHSLRFSFLEALWVLA